jgi:hypothetical protein
LVVCSLNRYFDVQKIWFRICTDNVSSHEVEIEAEVGQQRGVFEG